MRSKLSLLLVAFAAEAVHAQISNDFSNNLASDLGPIISLLGESMTKQYLSESTTILDYIIFALAPIGIMTVVVSVIRVCGSTQLRAFIGKAREGSGAIEAELCTSTSRDVCELFNNGGITRVLGKPKILELIFVPKQKEATTNSSSGRENLESDSSSEIFLFKDHLQRTCTAKGGSNHRTAYENIESSGMRSDWATQSKWAPSDVDGIEFPPNPNLTLNLGITKRSKPFFYAVALLGFLLEAAVLLVAGLGTFQYPWILESAMAEEKAAQGANLLTKNDSALLFVIGTGLLTFGVFMCACLIGEKTREIVFKQDSIGSSMKNASQLFWLQPGNQVIGDQTFDPYAISSSDKKVTEYVSSRLGTKEEVKRYPTLTWIAVIITVCGFVCQFIGLRGLGPYIALGQLAITLIMSFIRGLLRTRNLKNSGDNRLEWYLDLTTEHELDWLAFQFPHSCGHAPKQEDSGQTLGDAQLWFMVGHTVVQLHPETRKTDCAKEIFVRRTRLANLTGHYMSKSLFPHNYLDWADEFVRVRFKSKQLAKALGESADILSNTRVGKLEDITVSFPVCLQHNGKQHDHVRLVLRAPTEATPGGYSVDSAQLEALLGLWLWSLKRHAAQLDNTKTQWNFKPTDAINSRIVDVHHTGAMHEDLQTKMALWMGSSSAGLEKGRIDLNLSTNLGASSYWVERLISNVATVTPDTLFKLTNRQSQRSRRFFGWNAIDRLSLTVGPSETVEMSAEATHLQNAPLKRFHISYITLQGGSASKNTILNECATDIYSIALSHMASSSAIGTVTPEQRFGQLRLKNDTIAALEDVFTRPDNDLGTTRDAMLTILPAFKRHLDEKFSTSLIDELESAAIKLRYSGDFSLAERYLELACDICKRYTSSSPVDPSMPTFGHAIISLAQLYLWALSESTDWVGRCRAYDGFGKILGWLSHEHADPQLVFDTAALGSYVALALKIASEHGEDAKVSSIRSKFVTTDVLPNISLELEELLNLFGGTTGTTDIPAENRTRLLDFAKRKMRAASLYLLFTRPIDMENSQGPSLGTLGTVLSIAASNGWTDVVNILLEHGVYVDSEDEAGKTALIHFAQAVNHRQVANLLKSGAKAYHEDNNKYSGLLYAAMEGHTSVVSLFLSTATAYPNGNAAANFLPLTAAIFGGHEEVVHLLSKDPRVNYENEGQNGLSPLMAAVVRGDLRSFELIRSQSTYQAVSRIGHPLLVAAVLGHAHIVQALISHPDNPVDPNVSEPGLNEDLLLALGLPMEGRFKVETRTAISLAAEYGHTKVVEVLLGHAATTLRDQTKPRERPNDEETSCSTPLWYAAANGHIGIIELLLNGRDDVDVAVDEEQVVFDKSEKRYSASPFYIAHVMDQPAALRLFLQRLEADGRNYGFESAYLLPETSPVWERLFMLAVQNGRSATFDEFLKRDMYPMTPQLANMALDLASYGGRVTFIKILRERGLGDPNFTEVPSLATTVPKHLILSPFYDATLNFDTAVVKELLLFRQTDVNQYRSDNAGFAEPPLWKLADSLKSNHSIEELQRWLEIISMLLEDDRIDVMVRDAYHGLFSERIFARVERRQHLGHAASLYGDQGFVKILQHPQFDITKFVIGELHPLVFCCIRNYPKSLSQILDMTGQELCDFQHSKRTPLEIALQYKHASIVDLLLQDGRCVTPALVLERFAAYVRRESNSPIHRYKEDFAFEASEKIVDFLVRLLEREEEAVEILEKSIEEAHSEYFFEIKEMMEGMIKAVRAKYAIKRQAKEEGISPAVEELN